MGENKVELKNPERSKTKLVIGVLVLVFGFLSPLLIPLVVASNLSAATKSILSGLLAFGIPEVFMFAAIAIMGKKGYQHIKTISKKYLKRFAPPDTVGRLRYRIGLLFFCLPLVIGILQPYLTYFIGSVEDLSFWFHFSLDIIFVIGIFILGGDFWDKLRGLFQYDVKVIKP